jgi:hypothetical protein
MDTVDGTGAPRGPQDDEGRPGPPAKPGREKPATPAEKLAEADRHLLAIGAEVDALREELQRLREEASERGELLVEREVVIAELSGLLPTLDEARVQALRQAEAASAALVRTEARLSAQATQVADLQRQLATFEADSAARDELVAALEARVADERTKREALERELETLEAGLARSVAGLSDLEAAVSQVRSEHDEVTATLAAERPSVSVEVSDWGHLRFILRAGGYTVTSCDGDPPLPGQLIELDGERFTVAKIGRSPFPSDSRPCAYLLVEAEPGTTR